MNVVLPLFGKMEVPGSALMGPDPMEELLNEAYLPDEDEEIELLTPRRFDIVTETQFPDQSMYVLDKQLQTLKESLNRIRFYLGDVDSLIPSKKL